jgi:hypothetical protein
MVCPNLSELSAATGVASHEMEALLVAGEQQRTEHELSI